MEKVGENARRSADLHGWPVAAAVTEAAPEWSFGAAAFRKTLGAGMPRRRRPMGSVRRVKVQAAGSPGPSSGHPHLPSGTGHGGLLLSGGALKTGRKARIRSCA